MFDSHVSRRIWITEAAMFVEIGVALSSIFGFLLFLDWIFRKETKINGAHVVITGGSRGIGLALAIQMAECGANVTLIAKNKPRLEEARQKVERNLCRNKKAVCFSVDLADDPTEVEATINKARNLLGPVDILVNCAGYAVCGLFEETPVIDFKNQIHVNYLGSVYPTLAVVKSMKERRRGHIALVSSMGGQIGLFGYTAYTPSKFAVRGFAESLFMEVKPYNVGVSVVFPPDTDTPGFENENKTKPEETQIISNSGGLFTPDQVARRIINGIKTRQYLISIGFDGFNLKTLTCGTAPVSSWIELLLQVCLMGPLRFVSIFYAMYHDYVVRQGMKKRIAAAKRK